MPNRSTILSWRTNEPFDCGLLPNLTQISNSLTTLTFTQLIEPKSSSLPCTSNEKYSSDVFKVRLCKSCQDFYNKKKSVRFADDCGRALEIVRIVKEPLDYPPFISPLVINRHKNAAKFGANSLYTIFDPRKAEEDEKIAHSNWEIDFDQPASDYAKFRERLEKQNVAVENVIIDQKEYKLIGSIKVANIAFEKLVHVRVTFDNWQTYHDFPAAYQISPSKNHDTFCFNIDIPKNNNAESIKFCVKYQANENEFWDSNNGKNFVIVKSKAATNLISPK